jgi:hypothetical protein
MNHESFQQTVLDALGIINQKVDKLMTSNQDVMDAIAVNATALTALKTSIDTAVSDMGTGGDAARAMMVTALKSVAAQITTAQTELLAAIAAQTPPPVTPPAPPAA